MFKSVVDLETTLATVRKSTVRSVAERSILTERGCPCGEMSVLDPADMNSEVHGCYQSVVFVLQEIGYKTLRCNCTTTSRT